MIDWSISPDAKCKVTSCSALYVMRVILPMSSCDACLVTLLGFSDEGRQLVMLNLGSVILFHLDLIS